MSEVSHLSSRTTGTTVGGPNITVMQISNGPDERAVVCITGSGTGDWNSATRLNAFRDQLANRFAQHGICKVISQQTCDTMPLTSQRAG